MRKLLYLGGGTLVALGLTVLALGTAWSGPTPAARSITVPSTVKTTPPPRPRNVALPLTSYSGAARIIIAAAGVDAPVMPVTSDLARHYVQVPPLADRNLTGWIAATAAPGTLGASVIIGHLDNQQGPAVFWNLRYLQKGQLITVVRLDHRKVIYAVDGIQIIPKNRFPWIAVFTARYPALRLVTCGGAFDPADGHYLDNVIVWAHLVQI